MKPPKENADANSAAAASDEKEVEMKPNDVKLNSVPSTPTTPEKQAVQLKNVTAKWSENSAENSLNDVSVKVAQQTLLAIIGPVGAGKVSNEMTNGCSRRPSLRHENNSRIWLFFVTRSLRFFKLY